MKKKKSFFFEKKNIWKIIYAYNAFWQVNHDCEYILNKKIKTSNPIYYSLITSIHVNYGKPFTNSFVGKLSEKIIPSEFKKLHGILMTARHKIYAHPDAKDPTSKHGPCNQIRFIRKGKEVQCLSCQIRTDFNQIEEIKKLSEALQNTTKLEMDEYFLKYNHLVPMEEGEYILNIYDKTNNFVYKVDAVINEKYRLYHKNKI